MTTVVSVHWFPHISEDRIVTVSIKQYFRYWICHWAHGKVSCTISSCTPFVLFLVNMSMWSSGLKKLHGALFCTFQSPLNEPTQCKNSSAKPRVAGQILGFGSHLLSFRQKTDRFWARFPLSCWRFCAGLKWINKYKRTLTVSKSSNIKISYCTKAVTMSGSFTLACYLVGPALSFSLASSCTDVCRPE